MFEEYEQEFRETLTNVNRLIGEGKYSKRRERASRNGKHCS